MHTYITPMESQGKERDYFQMSRNVVDGAALRAVAQEEAQFLQLNGVLDPSLSPIRQGPPNQMQGGKWGLFEQVMSCLLYVLPFAVIYVAYV